MTNFCIKTIEFRPFGKSKTTQLLKEMGEKGLVKIEGWGRGAKYTLE